MKPWVYLTAAGSVIATAAIILARLAGFATAWPWWVSMLPLVVLLALVGAMLVEIMQFNRRFGR